MNTTPKNALEITELLTDINLPGEPRNLSFRIDNASDALSTLADLVKIARSAQPLPSVIIDISKEGNINLIDSAYMRVSIRDFDAAANEIKRNGLDAFKQEFGDHARSINGEWYVERGNIPLPTWEAGQKSDREFWVTSRKHGGLAIRILMTDNQLLVHVRGKEPAFDASGKETFAQGISIDIDQFYDKLLPEVIPFNFEVDETDASRAIVKMPGGWVAIKDDDFAVDVYFYDQKMHELIDSFHAFYDEIQDIDEPSCAPSSHG